MHVSYIYNNNKSPNQQANMSRERKKHVNDEGGKGAFAKGPS